MTSKKIKYLLILLFCSLFIQQAAGQDNATKLALARQFVQSGAYAKACPIYSDLYYRAPFDKSLYNEYLEALLLNKNLDSAQSLTAYMQKIRPQDLMVLADKAYILEQKGEKKAAETIWEEVITKGARDEYQLKLLAEALQKRNLYDKAIELYETGRQGFRDETLFAQELSLLYSAQGNKLKALTAMLDVAASGREKPDDIKNNIATIINNDVKLNKQFEKELKKRLEKQPNQLFLELWIWQRLNSGSGQELLEEVLTLDGENEADGYLLMQLGSMLYQNELYENAYRAFEMAEKSNATQSYNRDILALKNIVLEKIVVQHRPIDKTKAILLKKNYEHLFQRYPQYINGMAYLDYINARAIYLNEVDSAIVLLNEYIKKNSARKDVISNAKINLGDYYLLKGEQWEATLLYAQVDKDHKQDALGEMAKYKNAKLSYYFGDFDWAQQQLKILKTSSSDMIANDALYLSVLMTENTPLDSNYTPLEQFAKADLLIYQYKNQEASDLLNNILEKYPETPLVDDILMSKAKIAMEEGRYQDAVALLDTLYTQYKDDVLADDALLKLAQINEVQFKNKIAAQQYYEQLILEYPSSTYVQIARQKLKSLNQSKTEL